MVALFVGSFFNSEIRSGTCVNLKNSRQFICKDLFWTLKQREHFGAEFYWNSIFYYSLHSLQSRLGNKNTILWHYANI